MPGGAAVEAAEQTARNCKWSAKISPCIVSASGDKSSGVAVAVRNHIGIVSAFLRNFYGKKNVLSHYKS